MKTFYILLLIAIGCAGSLQAQQESSLYFLNTVSQSTYSNPAFIPKYATSFGLPGISSNSVSVLHTGFAYKDVISRREEDDSLQVNLPSLYGKLKTKNYLKLNTEVDIFHLAFKINPRIYFNLNVTQKNRFELMYPKEILGLFINGNAPLIGQEVQLSPTINGMGYLEGGLGLAYKINPFLTVGARFKTLRGIANITTDKAKFNLTTDTDYTITLQGEAMIRTAGVNRLVNDELEFEGVADVKEILSNNGYGIDIGATYQPIDKLTLAVSVIDFGSIKWTNNVTTYSIDPETSEYTFRGLDIEKAIEDNDDFDAELDSIADLFELQETEGAAYRSSLPTRFYVSGTYELARNLYAGLLLYSEKQPGDLHLSGSANLTKNFGKVMSFGLSYTAHKNSYNNLGAGLVFNFAPLQIYVIGDNVLGAPAALLTKKEINPYINGIQYFNLRFGVNFIGGWERKQEKLSDGNMF